MTMQVTKRNGTLEPYNPNKIDDAIKKAFQATNETGEAPSSINNLVWAVMAKVSQYSNIHIEEIQDIIQIEMCKAGFYKTAIAFAVYREKQKELRLIKDRAQYIETYSANNDNAATASEIDANANILQKNVATLEAEIYKPLSAQVSRYRVVKKLKELYGNDAPDYIGDLNSHIIYKHDEGAPAIKPYCAAVNMYPFMKYGTSQLDGLKTAPPNNLSAFCGQFNNLLFLLSSQFQGAVAFSELFLVFSYYCTKEFGAHFYEEGERLVVSNSASNNKTVSDVIEQSFQNIVYTLNQPAGNRGYQSPFTNISYYDKNYWTALFEDFVYPDGSKPEWEAIDYLQKKFMRWFNNERKKCLLTFPVETVAMLSDGNDIIDKDYKDFVAEMYAEGHSFFTYISDNADSLSSCCRLRNALEKSEFSFTNGLTGVATGSKSVITLNLNRIIQDFFTLSSFTGEPVFTMFANYLRNILSRVYKYHIAYNELLWDLYDHNMLPVYSNGYISLDQQFLTIGINGINEAAEFLGIAVSDHEKYQNFCNLITSTISEENRAHEKLTGKHKLKFNCEFVPAESLGIKNYDWDKEDGYVVPEDRNCYNSYFYKPDDDFISILDKFKLHGRRYVDSLDGGVALHCNLEEHLSKKQYLKLIEVAVKEGTNYFTFNVPNTECLSCGHISKRKLDCCPVCKSPHVSWWTRIIGYLKPITNFSKGRRVEARKRIYSKLNENEHD